MTSLSKFAAQQLTKKQMNEVTGGAYEPSGFDNCGVLYRVVLNGNTTFVCSKNEADMKLFKDAGAELTPEL